MGGEISKEERMKRVGEEIRRLRTDLLMSQETLASKAGFSSRAAISAIENGIRDCSLESLTAIADVLAVHPSRFLDIAVDGKPRRDFIIADQEKNQKFIIEATKGLTPQGMDLLKLYIASLRHVPGMFEDIEEPDDN